MYHYCNSIQLPLYLLSLYYCLTVVCRLVYLFNHVLTYFSMTTMAVLVEQILMFVFLLKVTFAGM